MRGSSTYVSPVVLVPKKNGGTRVCVDYTKVNSQTVPLNYPIPLIRDLVFRLQYNHSWFTVLDLREAYFSLPLTRRASRRAAIITYDGVFKPLCTQFGLKNAPARFCELVASMIRGLESSVFYYLDDFIIFSKTIDEHVVHVRQLLERLDEYGMYIQIEKCHFCEPQVNFLGYQISENGFLPMVDNVQAIRAMIPPTNLQELRRFLGMMNYYHNFIPKIAHILSPLYDLLKGTKRPKKRKLDWLPFHQNAFENAKLALVKITHLSLDDATKPLVLTTDGSATHCGAVLELMLDEGNNQPLAFFSKGFAKTTSCRSAFNRELTSIFLSVKHFKHFVRGRTFFIRTDHKALVNAINNGQGEHSINEQKMINYVKEYGPIMQHIPGSANPVADTLSRPSVELVSCVKKVEWSIPAMEEFAACQSEDPFLQQELNFIQSPRSKLKLVTRQLVESVLFGVTDDENPKFRPIVPRIFQSSVFHMFHDILHQGNKKSFEIIRRHYFWSTMREDVEKWVQHCPKCQCCKVTKHNRQALENFPDNPKRLSIVHIDVVGPLHPEVQEFKYLLTMRDRNTGFI